MAVIAAEIPVPVLIEDAEMTLEAGAELVLASANRVVVGDESALERDEFTKFAEERGEAVAEGESAMALAFRRAMEKKK